MPGIDADSLQAQEVQSYTGSRGLRDTTGQAAAIAGAFAAGVAGVGDYFATKRAKEEAKANEARLAEFQTAQIADVVDQNNAQIREAFTDEEFEKFQSASNAAERLQMAEAKGVSKQLVEVRRQRALSDAIAKDPANREEYVKIFKGIDTGEDRRDLYAEQLQQAEAKELGRKADALLKIGVIDSVDGLDPKDVNDYLRS